MYKFSWIWKMAYRDFRKSRGRLLLFISSIIIGIAALVGISSFGENLQKDIDRQARELLGADLVLTNNQPMELENLDSMAEDFATGVNFGSMVIFPATGDSRLTQVRALEGAYPFYGTLETSPPDAVDLFRDGGKYVLAEPLLLAQFGAAVGDSLQIGNTVFHIAGSLDKVPGQSGIVATVAPAVYIPLNHLESTGLVQYGSRLNYAKYYKLKNEGVVKEWVEAHNDEWGKANIRSETVEQRKQSTGRAFANLTDFLRLVAFIALLLGCVGVASSVNVFVKEKLPSVAVLRCIGASSRDTFMIFLFQILLMALAGSIIGAAGGTAIQYLLPQVVGDFLPMEVNFTLSWKSILFGLVTGIVVALLFALIPLLRIRKASPMMTLRPDAGLGSLSKEPLRWVVIAGIVLFVFGFSYYLTQGLPTALGFTFFVIFSFALLWGTARLTMYLLRRFIPLGLNYTIRQALANLYRPNNQTVSLIATIGLGTAMISTLLFVQTQLLDEVKLADKEDQPNMVMFDIQTHQLDEMKEMVEANGLPILQDVPIVTMRLNAINGINKNTNEEMDKEDRRSRSLYSREFRVTYRDTLSASETLVAGAIRKVKAPGDSIFVSFDRNYAENVGIRIGDEIEFNVQGRPMKVYVGSFRDVKFNQVAANFLVLFPENVLERAPKFHVLVTKTKNESESADIQRLVVSRFPNVSVINLGLIVETLEEILSKVSFVIRFMAFFSILTGILVLISALIISKYQRVRESILLRTLGASSGTVRTINTLEYFFLGSIATLSGILLSFLATAALSIWVFEIPFRPVWESVVLVYISITLLIVILSMFNNRAILKTPPMEVLR